MRKRLLMFAFTALSVFALSAIAFALGQDPTPIPRPEVNATLASALTAVGAAITPWAVWLFANKLLPVIPRAAIPLLPFVMGWLADQAIVVASGVHSPLGASGIGYIGYLLREIPHTVSEHGLFTGGGGALLASKT